MTDHETRLWGVRWPLLIGFGALVVLIGGLGVWSVNTRIAGAVIASGMIQVESNRQVVQHPQGGVVGEILAENGDRVEAGQVLLRLDGSLLQSELAIITGQRNEIQARILRLRAERDGLAQMSTTASDPALQALLDGQAQLFAARKESLEREGAQIQEQIVQARNQILGAESQLAAFEQQRQLNEAELQDKQEAQQRGLIQSTVVTNLQREQAQLVGSIGTTNATIAEIRGKIAALEIQALKLDTLRREDAITQLRDLTQREVELAERQLSLTEQLARMEMRSPVAGVVYGSSVFAVRSVISPAQPVMYIIPQDQPLVVIARIEAIHIDQVHIGQDVTLRFTAFDQRRTPEVFGRVARLSADVFTDERTGLSYYQADLVPSAGELDKLGGQELLPGMPVDAFIKTADRSPLSYLTKPFTDYFDRAFREG